MKFKKGIIAKTIIFIGILWLLKPFNILILGSDARPNQNLKGTRTDSIMVLKVTPLLAKIRLVSIPRDTYATIPCKGGIKDKITHAHAFGGKQCSIEAVETLLNTKINYSVLFRFDDVINITEVIGGVDIVANHTFVQDGEKFVKGETYNIQGLRALAYSRHRKTDSAFKRDERQRQIVGAMQKKLLSPEGLFKLSSVGSYLDSRMDIHFNPIKTVSMLPALIIHGANFDDYEITGTGTKIKGIYYFQANENSLNTVRRNFKIYF